MKRVLERAGIPKVRFHDLRHPYVKHTTKKYSCKSRNPKLPMPIDSLGFLFYFSFYDLASNAWWAISTGFLRKYFSCCAAFLAVMIMLFGHIIIRIFAIYSAKQTTSVELDQ